MLFIYNIINIVLIIYKYLIINIVYSIFNIAVRSILFMRVTLINILIYIYI